MNPETIRKDFKIFENRDIAYLDSGATSQRPYQVLKAVEEYYKDKGFENINLTTYGFQAPEFYKKCGFQVEFIRENKNNPKLTKYFLVKYY